ncbi:MAG: fimbria/pilus outer membrane usher protein, partial [Oceanococcus sp.]
MSGENNVPGQAQVYVNGTRLEQVSLSPGRFQINEIPVVTGSGTVELRVRDDLGREFVTRQAYYASDQLLKPGLFDFSFAIGQPRLDFATERDRYADDLLSNANVRLGVNSWMTLELHLETQANLRSGGLGSAMTLGPLGVLNLSYARSQLDKLEGEMLRVAYQFNGNNWSLFAAVQKQRDQFHDALSLQGVPVPELRQQIGFSFRPHRRLSINASLFEIGNNQTNSNFNQLCIDSIQCVLTGSRARFVNLSASARLAYRSTLILSANRDVLGDGDTTYSLGLSIPFGRSVYTYLDTQRNGQFNATSASVLKNIPLEGTGGGWRIRDTRGEIESQAVSAGYRSRIGTLELAWEQLENTKMTRLQLRGAAMGIGTKLGLSNQVQDSFAMIESNRPALQVLRENRPVGATSFTGKLILPNLNAYQANRLKVDETQLPINFKLDENAKVVIPALKSGVYVKFKVSDTRSASVQFLRAAGTPVPLGATVKLEGRDAIDVVGYDGIAYFENLAPMNMAIVRWPGYICKAQFAFKPGTDRIQTINQVPCR